MDPGFGTRIRDSGLGIRDSRVDWHEAPLTALDNDAWGASFTVEELGRYQYTVEAWIDRFGSWLKGSLPRRIGGRMSRVSCSREQP